LFLIIKLEHLLSFFIRALVALKDKKNDFNGPNCQHIDSSFLAQVAVMLNEAMHDGLLLNKQVEGKGEFNPSS